MASYLPSVTDNIPGITPFIPDYNFLSNVLQTKQTRYDQASKQIGSVYGSLLNSPMSREDNNNRRNDFFKNVDSQIEKLAGIDLSLKQNQDYAMQIFKPLYEDKSIIKDMNTTRNYFNQKQQAEFLRTCYDPAKCGGVSYSPEGVQYLDYKIQEFKDMSADEALSFQDPKYTPDPMVEQKAFKLIKDMGLGVKYDTVEGGYIVTRQNGQGIIGTLSSFLQSVMPHQPGVIDYYKTKAYLARKNYVGMNSQSMGEEAAFTDYYHNVFSPVSKQLDANQKDSKKDHDYLTALRANFQAEIRKNGILPDEKEKLDGYIEIARRQELAKQRLDYTDQGPNLLKKAGMNMNNTRVLADTTDEAVAMSMLNQNLGDIAKKYSLLTYTEDKKADPYALASFQADLGFKKDLAMKQIDFDIWKQKKLFEKEVENQISTDTFGEPIHRPDIIGTTTGPQSNLAQEDNRVLNQDLTQRVNSDITQYLSNLGSTMQAGYSASGVTPDQQIALKGMAKEIFKHSGIDGEKLVAGDEGELEKLRTGQYKMIELTYNKAKDLSNPEHKELGEANKFWNEEFYNSSLPISMEISKNIKSKQIFEKDMKENTKNTLTDLKSDYNKEGEDLKGFLAESMLNSVDGKYIPSIQSEEDKQVQAEIFATKNARLFNSKADAVDWALDNVEDVTEDWNTKYAEKNTSFRQHFGGKTANSTTGSAYQLKFDMNYKHPDNRLLSELVSDVKNNPEDVIYSFGNSVDIPENSPEAKEVARLFIGDLRSPLKGEKSDIRGDYTVSSVASGDPNYMAFTVYPGEKWKKLYKGTQKEPGATSNPDISQGITMTIPVNKAANSYYRNSQVDEWDYILSKNKEIIIDDIPSGNLKLKKTDNTYYITGDLKVAVPTDTGYKYEQMKINSPGKNFQSLDAGTLYDNWTRALMTLHMKNQEVIQDAKNAHGLTQEEIDQLLTSILRPDGTQ